MNVPKIKISLVLFLFLLFPVNHVWANTTKPQKTVNVLSRFDEGKSTLSTAQKLHTKIDLSFRHLYERVFHGFSGRVSIKHLQNLLERKEVNRVELNRKVSLMDQGKENNTPQSRTHSSDTIKEVKANNVDFRDLPLEQINIAVMDTKVDEDHDYLKGQVTHKPYQTMYHEISINSLKRSPSNILNDLSALSPMEGSVSKKPQNHGTHVAGLIGGQLTEKGKQFGVAPGVNLYDVTVIPDMSQYTPYVGDFCKGLDWIAGTSGKKKIDAVNMSLGLPSQLDNMSGFSAFLLPGWTSYSLDESIQTVVKEERIPVIVAAGNESSNVDGFWYNTVPAAYPETITVSAITKGREFAKFSNFGKAVDVTAPGNEVLSSIVEDHDNMEFLDGTSMSTPVVTGVVALMQAAAVKNDLTLSPDEIRNILVKTGTKPNGHWNWRRTSANDSPDYKPTEPLVNAEKAVHSVLQTKMIHTVDETGETVTLSKNKYDQLHQRAQRTGEPQTTTLRAGEKNSSSILWGLFGSETNQYQVKVDVQPDGTIQKNVDQKTVED